MIFKNREHAGLVLAGKLKDYAGQPHLVVLGLPRGGVPVAYQVALSLGAELDVFVVRKLGFPGQPELAMGAIASGGVTVLNDALIKRCNVSRKVVDNTIAAEKAELQRRESMYKPGHQARGALENVIIVDDGLATGSTMVAAVNALRKAGCRELTIAVPVGAAETCAIFGNQGDKIVCAHMPNYFGSVGQWYEDFSQTSDEEVRRLLEKSRAQVAEVHATLS
jgi:putative phosphoribosyl transferase